MLRGLALAAAATAVACAAAPGRAAWHRADGASLPVWTAGPDGEALAVPLVRVEVGGHPVEVVLDSGATQHFVVDAVAWLYGIRSERIDPDAVDTSGRLVPFRRARDRTLRAPGWPASATPYLFVVESRALAAAGFAGGLSPQLVAPPGHATVVDLPAGRLEVLAAGRLAAEDRPTLGRVCPAGDDPRDGWHHVVPVEVSGLTVEMLVDTGSGRTTLLEGTEAGRALAASAARAEAAGAEAAARTEGPRPEQRAPPFVVVGAGGEVEGLALVETEVDFGGARRAARVGLVPGPGRGRCGEDGVLGFDLLRTCRLAFGRGGLAARCAEGEAPRRTMPRRAGFPPLRLEAVEAEAGCGLSAADLAPNVTGQPLPFAYESAVEAYVDLHDECLDHASIVEERCRDEGYLDARVPEPLRRRGRRLRVLFAVEQGPRYRVGAVSVVLVEPGGAERRLDGDDLPWLRTRPGEPYRRETVSSDLRSLEPFLASQGLRVDRASESEVVDRESRTVEVGMRVEIAPAGRRRSPSPRGPRGSARPCPRRRASRPRP